MQAQPNKSRRPSQTTFRAPQPRRQPQETRRYDYREQWATLQTPREYFSPFACRR